MSENYAPFGNPEDDPHPGYDCGGTCGVHGGIVTRLNPSPVEDERLKKLFSELVQIAGAMAQCRGFISPYADDNPKSTPQAILRQAEQQQDKLKDWAYRVRQVANQLLSLLPIQPAASTPAEKRRSNHFSDEAIDRGFPDHISRDGDAYYRDGTVIRAAASTEAQDEKKSDNA